MEQQEIGPGFIWDGRDCYRTQTTLTANFNMEPPKTRRQKALSFNMISTRASKPKEGGLFYLLYLITHRRQTFAIHIKENHRCNNCSCDHPNNSWGAQKVSHSGSNK